MNELIAHCMLYPAMQIQDAVKLLYQQQYGGGHLVADEAENLRELQKEYEGAEGDMPLVEPIGGGMARLWLAPARKEGLSPVLIQKLFLAGIRRKRGNRTLFRAKLSRFVAACEKGLLPFSPEEVRAYLSDYAAEGFPPVHHSEAYKEAYKPAYRLIPADFARLLPLFQRLEDWDGKTPFVVAIDGNCGSGKTTLAELLMELYSCDVIHMDDFFLPSALRTEAREEEAGGNIHYERFCSQVLPHLQDPGPFTYRRFSCSLKDFDGELTVERPLRIVEGSYSMHEKFADAYDYKVFLSLSPELQEERLLKRVGPESMEMFRKKWIPLENAYFSAMRVEERCDLSVKDLCLF